VLLMAASWYLCTLVDTHVARVLAAAVVAVLYLAALAAMRRRVGPLQQLLVRESYT